MVDAGHDPQLTVAHPSFMVPQLLFWATQLVDGTHATIWVHDERAMQATPVVVQFPFIHVCIAAVRPGCGWTVTYTLDCGDDSDMSELKHAMEKVWEEVRPVIVLDPEGTKRNPAKSFPAYPQQAAAFCEDHISVVDPL